MKTENGVTGKLYLEAPLPGMGRRLTGDNGQKNFKKDYFTCTYSHTYKKWNELSTSDFPCSYIEGIRTDMQIYMYSRL